MRGTTDFNRVRADPRRRHDGKDPPVPGGPVQQLSPEEIATMDPNKPTPKRIVVDELPRVPETIAQTKTQIREAVQFSARAICRKSTKDLQILDEKDLSALSTITLILDRLDKAEGPTDPTKLTDEEVGL